MKKLLFLLVPFLFLIGCQTQDDSLFYLNAKYYDNGAFTPIYGEELRDLEENNNSFIAFVFMPMCNASALFYDVVSDFINDYEISMYKIQFSDIEDTRLADAITYFPTAVIYREGVVRTFLQTDKNEHIPYYQSVEGFGSWLAQYIYLPNELAQVENDLTLTENDGTQPESNNDQIENDDQAENDLSDAWLPRHSSLDDISFEEDVVNIYYFWGDGCPHCTSQFEFLIDLNEEIGEQFNLYSFEIWFDSGNVELMQELAEIMDVEFRGVPFTIIGNQTVTGFRPDEIEDAINAAADDEFDIMQIFKEQHDN